MGKPKRESHPANAPGDFYDENEICITCMAPHVAAPELMGMRPQGHCYFKKQPSTPEELEHAIEAVCSSCVAGLRYAGDDPEILERLLARGCASECDALDGGGGRLIFPLSFDQTENSRDVEESRRDTERVPFDG